MFKQDVADSVCALLSEGKSLREAAKSSGTTFQSVLRWVDANASFSEQYAHARQLGYLHLADEIITIADTPQMGVKSTLKATGMEITEGDMIEHRRLQVDARKWMLAKMLPKVYGDKQTIELNDITPLTPEQTDKRIAELMAKAAAKAP